jgi:hypothetical protein
MISINRKLGKLAYKGCIHHSLPKHIKAPPGCYFYPVVDDSDDDHYVGVSCMSDYLLRVRGIAGNLIEPVGYI